MNRVKTGIFGFDELIGGGFPELSSILLSGSPGTGKTIFSLQYIYNGAKDYNEGGIFVSLGEGVEQLKANAKLLGIDLDSVSDKVKIIAPNLDNLGEFMKKIKESANEIKPKRMVIDSLTTAEIYAPSLVSVKGLEFMEVLDGLPVFTPPILGEAITRRAIDKLIRELKKIGCTSIFTSELFKASDSLSRDTVSEFLVDGVIILKRVLIGDKAQRVLVIEKMRSTKQDENVHKFDITSEGIIVK
ncbi:hypothetical protein BEH94_05095 [Candidatus Altiarchaeales archaeon WOR_SM1_SCG]|nr:hypothetical protein BEH94_05095 [Candidatus Altiarchaeales archaeon WOR_SM1_SCG]